MHRMFFTRSDLVTGKIVIGVYVADCKSIHLVKLIDSNTGIVLLILRTCAMWGDDVRIVATLFIALLVSIGVETYYVWKFLDQIKSECSCMRIYVD